MGIKNVNWAAGINLMNFAVSTVDIDWLNKGKDGDEVLPDTATLYDKYADWGIITDKEKEGGFFTSLKAGLVYDSRDNEPNPNKGIWSEAVLFQSFNSEFTFTKIAITHRQYFSLIKNNLSFAYRLGYQGIIAGDAPFYMLPYMVSSFSNSSNIDGLGGSKTVRGMVRNRVVGESVAYGNLELRWKFTHFKFINQNFYLALNPFMDFGQVLKEREVEWSNIDFGTENASDYFKDEKDELHITYGCGIRIAMNQNFIIAADMGFPANEQDGDKGLYIGLNFLF
jgi:outer membrane protein assembly factor BamA